MEFDYILVGGGLQNGLMVLALLHHAPLARIALVERGNSLGGNQIWSYHDLDVPKGAAGWLEPLVVRRWSGYAVRFSAYHRILKHPYVCITAKRLDHLVRSQIQDRVSCRLYMGFSAVELQPHMVRLEDGRVLRAETVVDARGIDHQMDPGVAGFQKFLGLEVELSEPGQLEHPLVMDALVDQQPGYRFVYVLPLSSHSLLLEDTTFHQRPNLDRTALRKRIMEYAASKNIRINRVTREEFGVLPMPFKALPRPRLTSPIEAGMRGGWFHPATGYSFPTAVRLAEFLAGFAPRAPELSSFERLYRKHERQARFARLLNRMLFRMLRAKNRRKIFERFYRLPEDTIQRFYAMKTTALDRARILLDRPPFAPWFRIPGGAEYLILDRKGPN